MCFCRHILAGMPLAEVGRRYYNITRNQGVVLSSGSGWNFRHLDVQACFVGSAFTGNFSSGIAVITLN